MKKMIALLLLFTAMVGYGQESDCNYKLQVDTEAEQFVLTNAELAEYMLGLERTVFIYFSLMKEADVKSLVIQLSVNAKKQVPPMMCFNKDSRVSFQLEDGSFVSLRYLGDELCGRQTENEDTLHNSTSEAAFFLDETSLKRLSESEILSMRLTTMRTNFDVAFQDVLSNEELPVPIYPKEFFLNYLQCLE